MRCPQKGMYTRLKLIAFGTMSNSKTRQTHRQITGSDIDLLV